MATITRKIHFYSLVVERQRLIKTQNEVKSSVLSLEEIKKIFETKYKEMPLLSNGNRTVNIKKYNDQYTIDIVEYSNDKAIIKIGQKSPNNTVEIINEVTMETNDVPLSDNQHLQTYTLCEIDFSTGIVSFIWIASAPKISALKFLFSIFSTESEYINVHFPSIVSVDMIKKLSTKNLISKVEFEVAVPQDNILSDSLGISEKDFNALKDIKYQTTRLKLVGERNKSIFASPNNFMEFINVIISNNKGKLKFLNVSAKNYGEKTQVYNVLEYDFTKSVNFVFENIEIAQQKEYIRMLDKTYEENKYELLQYVKSN